jgi:hypothetical protein
MSLLKSEAKLTAVNELGNRLDDALESATKDLYREEGAVNALRNAAVSIENLVKVVSKDLDEKETDLEVSKTIKSYLERARNNIVNLANIAENSKQAQAGKINAFQQAVSIAKKYRDEEINRQQLLKRALERNLAEENQSSGETAQAEESQGRAVGTRPGPSIKLRRLTEDALPQAEKVEIESQEEKAVEKIEEQSSKIKTKKQKK